MAERHSHADVMAHLTKVANSTRDTADETAAMFEGCDDPLHPWPIPGQYPDWLDFVEKVARPLVEAGRGDKVDKEAEQTAMRLYRKACPYYICTALVMAANRVQAEAL